MRIGALLLALALGAAIHVSAQAPTDLLVVISGSKEFHQPGCPLVARAGSNVKVMKRSEATRRGLTAHDCPSEPGRVVTVDPNQVKVYSQPGDKKYHTATCPKLGATRTTMTLAEAGKKLWPCPACHPPIRQRTTTG